MAEKVTLGAKEVGHLTPRQYLALLEDPYFYQGLWRDSAACVTVCNDFPDDYHPTDWFPASSHEIPHTVMFVCGECPVRLECLAYAIRTRQEEGIWGGKSEYTVKQIRRRLIQAVRKIDQREAKEIGRSKYAGGKGYRKGD